MKFSQIILIVFCILPQAQSKNSLSCGVMKISDQTWVKKPTVVPEEKVPIKKGHITNSTTIYDKEYWIQIEMAGGVNSLTVSKSEKVLVGILFKGSDPLQAIIPESELQVICNSESAISKVSVK